MSNLPKLVYWINERYKVMKRKNLGHLKPWSQDPTFQETYFCNVHRENDYVTRWIRRVHVAEGCPLPELNMLIARFVNKPESLAKMMWPFVHWSGLTAETFRGVMGEKGAWGNAYIVSTNGRSMPKHEYIAELITQAYHKLEWIGELTTLEQAHKELMKFNGLGSFMAAQIVADLKNTPWHQLATAPDWWTWCAHGPGSLRGMAWVIGEGRVNKADFDHSIPWLREAIDDELDYDVIPKFCNQDLQNCLCEFDKFMRVSKGVGRSKRKYDGK